MSGARDCLRCGACCFSQSELHVRVTGDDWARLGEAAERLAHFLGNKAYLRMRDHHCAALEFRSTADGAPEFFCTIYDRRPQICRDLARGSPGCDGEIALKTPLIPSERAATGGEALNRRSSGS